MCIERDANALVVGTVCVCCEWEHKHIHARTKPLRSSREHLQAHSVWLQVGGQTKPLQEFGKLH